MPEIAPIKTIPFKRPPSSRELARWKEAQQRMRDLDALVYRAGLLLTNVVNTYHFADTKDLRLPDFPPSLERRFLKVRDESRDVKELVRKVQDREYGLRWTGSDFDVIEPPSALQGIFIPIAIGTGIVALGGLIARLVYLEGESTELGDKYNTILEKTDRQLCADPFSSTCRDWERTKADKDYTKNETMADTIRGSVKTVSKGLGTGLLIAVPLLAYAIFMRKK